MESYPAIISVIRLSLNVVKSSSSSCAFANCSKRAALDRWGIIPSLTHSLTVSYADPIPSAVSFMPIVFIFVLHIRDKYKILLPESILKNKEGLRI